MTRTPADVTLERAALGPLKKLGAGGQAKVYLLDQLPPLAGAEGAYVFKQYHKRILDESAHSLATTMPQLILHPDGFSEAEQRMVRRHTVWPQALVMENGRAQGILMKLIPEPFFFDLFLTGSGRTSRELLELQYIMAPEQKKSERRIPAASLSDRLTLGLDVLTVVAFLHSKRLVIGDFSPKNVVVTNPKKFTATNGHNFVPKLLDVDAIRFEGGMPAIQQFNTPNWFPPEVRAASVRRDELVARGASAIEIGRAHAAETTQTVKSDVFKVGLLMLRLLHVPVDANEDDTQSVYMSETATRNLTRLVNPVRASVLHSMLDTDPHSRPTARQVLDAFTSR